MVKPKPKRRPKTPPHRRKGHWFEWHNIKGHFYLYHHWREKGAKHSEYVKPQPKAKTKPKGGRTRTK